MSSSLEIGQYRGDIGPYLAPAPGKVSLHLLKMLVHWLHVTVRAGIMCAKKNEAPIREEAVDVDLRSTHGALK